jgi:hypothetical protein
MRAGKPARGADVVEDKAELASLLEAEKSRRRLLEQRFTTAQEEAEKLRSATSPRFVFCLAESKILVYPARSTTPMRVLHCHQWLAFFKPVLQLLCLQSCIGGML